MSDAPPDIMACLRQAELPIAVEGSLLIYCGDCEAPMWIAEHARAVVAASPGIAVLCLQCANKRVSAVAEVEVRIVL